MSLFQNYTGDLIAAATRTAEQQKMFERCMGTMHLWYGNAHIHIWMMSVVPSYATRQYDERGWCKFEKRVGGIITPRRALSRDNQIGVVSGCSESIDLLCTC